jgi:hypothetical protein
MCWAKLDRTKIIPSKKSGSFPQGYSTGSINMYTRRTIVPPWIVGRPRTIVPGQQVVVVFYWMGAMVVVGPFDCRHKSD